MKGILSYFFHYFSFQVCQQVLVHVYHPVFLGQLPVDGVQLFLKGFYFLGVGRFELFEKGGRVKVVVVAFVLLLKTCEGSHDLLKILIFPLELQGKGLDGADSAFEFLMYFDHLLLEFPVLDLDQLLQFLNLALVFQFDALEGFDELFEDIDQRFGLLVVLDVGLLAVLIDLHLVFEHFPELVVLVDEHFHFVLDLLVVGVGGVAVEFLDGLGEFGVDSDEFLQRLFEDVVLLLQLLVAFLQFLVLAFPREVVLESVGHCYDCNIIRMNAQKFNFKKILEYLNKEESKFNILKGFFRNVNQHERKNRDNLQLFCKDIAQNSGELKNKNIARIVNNFGIHSLELEQSSEIKMVGDKIGYWVEELTKSYADIKEKLKNMERRKDTLTAADIEKYKAELTEDMIAVTQKKESVIQLYCYSVIKNNSQQIQRLTNSMQKQKKRQSLIEKK